MTVIDSETWDSLFPEMGTSSPLLLETLDCDIAPLESVNVIDSPVLSLTVVLWKLTRLL